MDLEQKQLLEELLGTEEKPSFAKLLYYGIFDAKRVLPFPTLASEQLAREEPTLNKLKTFFDTEINPDKIDREANIPLPIIRELGNLGLLGMTIPTEHGGLGFSHYTYCKAEELLARRCASTALFVNAHQSIGLKGLLLFGTEEQKKRYLPKLASGELIAAFSLTEPNAGSDAAGVQTRATYDPERKVYRLNGIKQWTTNGSIAGLLTVMAQTEMDTPQGKRDKITAFLVTPDMPGFKVRDAALEKVGMRGTKTANLQFDNMEVPESNILGPKGGGLRVALTLLDYGRTTFGATCTGTAKDAYERALQHAKTRYQFKRPLASFGLVKDKLARMAALTYAMEATTYLTAGLIDQQEEDVMLESAILKVFASESQWSILYDSMQIFGGRSFFTDLPLERMMRDSRLNMIGEGANEVMRAFIGAVGMRDLGLRLKSTTDLLWSPSTFFKGSGSLFKQLLHRLRTPDVPVRSRHLAKESKELGRAIRKFGFAILGLLASYREEVVERQLDLDRIASAAIALYTSTAVLSKLDMRLAQEPAEAIEIELLTGKRYLQMALFTLHMNLKRLSSKRDAQIEQLADRLTR